jgi:hypothetical protein
MSIKNIDIDDKKKADINKKNFDSVGALSNMMVDFTAVEQAGIGEIKLDPKEIYLNCYDDTTTVYYKAHRIKKTDPITYEELNDDTCFKFKYMWDPYTGKRLDEDPYGPLCFNPINILRHIYGIRLNKLWMDGEDGFEGAFSDGVGSGEDIEIPSRGIYPECHIFRLPVSNCYLKKTHKLSLVSMGPLLTNREICELDRLIVKKWTNSKFYRKIYKKIGSLYKLKCYYDIALAKNPIDMDLSCVDMGTREEALEQENPNLYLNFRAVEIIRDMV